MGKDSKSWFVKLMQKFKHRKKSFFLNIVWFAIS